MERLTEKKENLNAVSSAWLMETAWAMFKYLPRLFTALRINGHDFLSPSTIECFVTRVKLVRPETKRVWRAMKPAW